MNKIKFEPVGYVKSLRTEMEDDNWSDFNSQIIIREELKTGLKSLDSFSHAIIICHMDRAEFIPERDLARHPRGNKEWPEVGIFAQRAKHRPNPIGMTSVKIISVEDNILTVNGLDAIDSTPVLDIKPYFPQFENINNSVYPEWVDEIMKNYF